MVTAEWDSATADRESGVRWGNAAVPVVRKNHRGRSGGGGAFALAILPALLTLNTFRRVARFEGLAQ